MKEHFLLLSVFFFLLACVKDKALEKIAAPETNYPIAIEKILVNKCAISGCHDPISNYGANRLNLATWDELFKGGRNNSSVIPYRPDQSILFFSINNDTATGPVLIPTMPYNHPPLTKMEINTIQNWIANGAPSINENIKFSGNPERQKLYVANQGCDLVTIFDFESGIIMPCIDVGVSPSIESPHFIADSPDNRFWYV